MSVIQGEGPFLFQVGVNVEQIIGIGENGTVRFRSPDGARVLGELLQKVFKSMCMTTDGIVDEKKGEIKCLACSKHCQLSKIFKRAASSVTVQ